jgi:hypothetical protein
MLELGAGVRVLSGIAVVTVVRVTSTVARVAKPLFIFGAVGRAECSEMEDARVKGKEFGS